MSLLLGLTCSMTFVSCSDDDPEKKEQKDGGKGEQPTEDPEKNTTDVAVTGPVLDYGALYADIKGVVNLNAISASYSKVGFGITISETPNMDDGDDFWAENLVGRTIEAHFLLYPSTTYYYATFVNVPTLSYVYWGKTYSFTTKPINKDAAVTGSVLDIGAFSAKISGTTNPKEVYAAGAEAFASVQISEDADFNDSFEVEANDDIEKFNVEVKSLVPNTKYYYRTCLTAHSQNEEWVVIEGNTQSFTTKGFEELDNSNHYVDLGLPSGTLWATMNVGASKPEEYGDYFAWGETEGYNSGKTSFFFLESYKWCKGSSNTMTKYCTDSSYGYNGFMDKKTELDPEDDAAYVNWGSKWRMPTYDQLKELRDQCSWTWMTINNVKGYLVEGKNCNAVFLPAAGYRSNTWLNGAGSGGNYWSRTLNSDDPSDAWFLGFYSSYVRMYDYDRYFGQSIRPVRSTE